MPGLRSHNHMHQNTWLAPVPSRFLIRQATTSAMQLVGDAGADAGGVAAPSGAPASAAMDIDEEAPRGGQDDSR